MTGTPAPSRPPVTDGEAAASVEQCAIAARSGEVSADPSSSTELADSPRFPDFSGQVIAGRFRISSILAEGGMSRVYTARQIGLDRDVAVKFLRPGEQDWVSRFEREAKVLATLSHANLVTVYDYGTHEGFAYLVMELVEGRTLSDLTKSAGALAPHVAIRIALQIASGLAESHAVGIVHRDLKPANILVSDRRHRVKVIDFGIAKDTEDTDDQKTQTDVRIGSPRYMAPEQVAGEPVTPATDVYALGCVLYTMLSGAAPFGGKNRLNTMLQHLHQVAAPVRSRMQVPCSLELDAIVMKCLEKEPGQRWSSMEALAQALLAAPEQAARRSSVDETSASELITTSAVMLGPPRSAPPSVSRGPDRSLAPKIAVVALGLLAGLMAAYLFATSGSEDTRAEPSSDPEIAATGEPAAGDGPLDRPADAPAQPPSPSAEAPPATGTRAPLEDSQPSAALAAHPALESERVTGSRPLGSPVARTRPRQPRFDPVPPPEQRATSAPESATQTTSRETGAVTDNLDPWED